MEADAILKELGENPKQSTLYSAANIANLYILKPLELTDNNGWYRIYERGSGGAMAQTKAIVVAVPKMVEISFLEALYLFDGELEYLSLVANASKNIPIIRNEKQIGYIKIITLHNERTAKIYVESEYLGIKEGDTVDCAAAKLFGEDAAHQMSISHSATEHVFAAWWDMFLVNGKARKFEVIAKPYYEKALFALSESKYLSEHVADIDGKLIVHSAFHTRVNDIEIIPEYSIVGEYVNGKVIFNDKYAEVEVLKEEYTFGSEVFHGVYVLKNSIQNHEKGSVLFSLHGYRKMEIEGVEYCYIRLSEVYAYIKDMQLVTTKDYRLFEPIEGNIVKHNNESHIFVQDISGNLNIKRYVRVLGKDYILGFEHQLVAKLQ